MTTREETRKVEKAREREIAEETYAELRRRGSMMLNWADGGYVPMLRYRAHRDGLVFSQSRGSRSHLSRSQARTRPIHVALARREDPTTIYAPDATERPA